MSVKVNFVMPGGEECWANVPIVPKPGDLVNITTEDGEEYSQYTVGNDPVTWVIPATEISTQKKPKPQPDAQTATLKLRLL